MTTDINSVDTINAPSELPPTPVFPTTDLEMLVVDLASKVDALVHQQSGVYELLMSIKDEVAPTLNMIMTNPMVKMMFGGK